MKQSKTSGGFTLVELLVTLALLTILLGTSVFGLVAWQDHMDGVQADAYASALFRAAQNRLSSYSRSGQLEEFQAQLKGMDQISSRPGEYEAYLGGTLGEAALERGADVVFELVAGTVQDGTVLDGTITIRLDAQNGQVLEVFYGEQGYYGVNTRTDTKEGT